MAGYTSSDFTLHTLVLYTLLMHMNAILRFFAPTASRATIVTKNDKPPPVAIQIWPLAGPAVSPTYSATNFQLLLVVRVETFLCCLRVYETGAPQRPSATIAKGHSPHFHWCRPTRQYQERRWLPDGHWQVLGFRPDLRLPVVECMASATRCDPVVAPPLLH